LDNNIEEWRDIEGYEGLYKISNYGRVKSYQKRTEKILKPNITEKGYFRIALYLDVNNRKTFKIHRLVAKAFIPNLRHFNEVNHKDGNRQNNFYTNLEWQDHHYNCNHQIQHIYPNQNITYLHFLIKDVEFPLVNIYKNDIMYIYNISYKYETDRYFNERWKDIKGYEGLYKVSDFGRVMSFHKNKYGKLMTLVFDRHGYLKVNLKNKYHKSKNFTVHRLVGFAFIGCENEELVINHIDNNRTNNNVENLEFCTQSYNFKYSYIIDPNKNKGESNFNSILTTNEVKEIYYLAWKGEYTRKEIANKFKTNEKNIDNIKYGSAWREVTKHIKKGKRHFKLSDKEVLEIYNLSWDGNLTRSKIAEIYEIHEVNVSRIKHGHIWNHLTNHKNNNGITH
jgi:hypothetical protein